MKKILSMVGTLIIALAMCFTTVVATPVTAEAASKLNATAVKLKAGKTKTIKIKNKYKDKYYLGDIYIQSGDAEALESRITYSDDYSSVTFTGKKKGTVKLQFAVINRSTYDTDYYTVKFTVSGKAKVSAVDFDIVDVNGKVKNISKFFDKPTLVNFWADWCGPCMNEMPEMYEAYKEYKDKVNFLFVNVDSNSASDAKATLKKKTGGNMPTYIDYNYSASSAMGISSIPRIILIDKNGKIVHDQTGSYPSASAIKDDIEKYLLKK